MSVYMTTAPTQLCPEEKKLEQHNIATRSTGHC